MKMPKKQRRYCPFCRKHTQHAVEEAKRKPRRQTTKSQRRFLRKLAGYGSFPKENPKGREKPTRKLDLRFVCAECKRKHPVGDGFRIKKLEFLAEGQAKPQKTKFSQDVKE